MLNKVALLKFVDRMIGSLLLPCFTAPRQNGEAVYPGGCLFVRPGGIGDAVLLIPTLLLFKKHFPDAGLTVLAEKRNGAVFQLCPAVDKLLLYDRAEDFLALRGSRFDTVIDTEQWHRLSSMAARLVCRGRIFGFATNERQRIFSDSVRYSHEDYEAESFFRLLTPLHIVAPEALPVPFLRITPALHQVVDVQLAQVKGSIFVVIFPGASISERRWGSSRFRDVARRLQDLGIPVVVVGGKADESDGELIVSESGGINLAGKTSLAETAAVIEKSALLVSGDSGILHIAAGLGKPTVSLFGPGIENKWAPRGDDHIVINKHLSCSPCTKFGYTPKCPINAKCMSNITVDEVFDAVLRLLKKTGNRPDEKK